MTYIATTPDNVSVQVAQSKDIDTFRMEQVEINFDPNDPTAMYLLCTYTEGYVESSVYYPVTRFKKVRLDGAALATAMNAMADDTKSIYTNVKEGVWQLLADEGRLPAGAIS